jgi:hypothetical protein
MTNYNISSQRDEIDMLQKDVDQLKVRLLVMSSQLSGIERLMTEKKSDKMTVLARVTITMTLGFAVILIAFTSYVWLV